MGWQPYGLDREAHKLVSKYKNEKDGNDWVIKQSHKMRVTVAYGLERFWGEHLRLQGSSKGAYWKDVWNTLADILKKAEIVLPKDENIDITSKYLWGEAKIEGKTLTLKDSQLALAVLTQLCDSLVWWTQRYKGGDDK